MLKGSLHLHVSTLVRLRLLRPPLPCSPSCQDLLQPVTESFMPYALLLHRPGRSQPPPRAVLQHSAKPFYAAAREVNEASGPAATCATEYKCLQFAHQNVE
nr:uncharacterized protein LOC109774205 isoform X7 [Aegilops tauschii subsp. strangulata]